MTYQVLARKWRPRNFKELVGQEHVQRALINALDNDRLHHAFLFTGTRGVGKTTIARILAKSLNCETGVTSTPCGQCSACTEINDGRFVDLIEVDAASRTKVEDTRELLENVQYAPTRGRYKVYLIDEVHMLSTHSFNALLKTLEEPPLHVKFLLATTDPQKLPVTILSRCLQFNLKRLPIEQIQGHLLHILNEENIQADSEALTQISRAADGSMRDALSLLDQAIAYGGGGVSNQEVRAMLGTIEQNHILDMLEHLAAGDATGIMQKVRQLAEHAFDFSAVLNELITHLHYVALAQVTPQSVDDSLTDADKISAIAARLAAEDVQLFYQIALIGRRDLPLAPDARLGFEMILLRMLAFQPASGGSSSPPPISTSGEKQPTQAAAAPQGQRVSPAMQARAELKQAIKVDSGSANTNSTNDSTADPIPQEPAANIPAPVQQAATSGDTNWLQLVDRLDVSGLTQQLALHCAVKQQTESEIKLELAETRRHLLNASRLDALQQAVNSCLGHETKITVDVVSATEITPADIKAKQAAQKQQNAEQSIYNDQTVKTLINTFDAQVSPESITPVD